MKRVIVGSVVLTLCWSWTSAALAQAPAGPGNFANVVSAARAWPGCLGVETGQTASGRRIIFAWFENKKALVAWYHGTSVLSTSRPPAPPDHPQQLVLAFRPPPDTGRTREPVRSSGGRCPPDLRG